MATKHEWFTLLYWSTTGPNLKLLFLYHTHPGYFSQIVLGVLSTPPENVFAATTPAVLSVKLTAPPNFEKVLCGNRVACLVYLAVRLSNFRLGRQKSLCDELHLDEKTTRLSTLHNQLMYTLMPPSYHPPLLFSLKNNVK